ncbi:MAG: hypothetical protein SFX73_07975 [Kofleriaceae bacterium]|nr:hypothetical protein [Kofleriaceae bacterium]
MRCRAGLLLLLITACGRFEFDARSPDAPAPDAGVTPNGGYGNPATFLAGDSDLLPTGHFAFAMVVGVGGVLYRSDDISPDGSCLIAAAPRRS